jgi:integrase/recombinase XerD
MARMLRGDRIISPQELKRLITETRQAKDVAVTTGKHLEWARDYFVFALTSMTGLRISEVAHLKWRDVLDDSLIVRMSKGGKSRTVYYGKQTEKLLTEYRAIFETATDKPIRPEEHLFHGQRGPISRHGLQSRFRHWAKRINLRRGVTFHSLRHSYATVSLSAGVDLGTVRDQLGHSNISITSVYIHHTDKGKEAIQKLF